MAGRAGLGAGVELGLGWAGNGSNDGYRALDGEAIKLVSWARCSSRKQKNLLTDSLFHNYKWKQTRRYIYREDQTEKQ